MENLIKQRERIQGMLNDVSEEQKELVLQLLDTQGGAIGGMICTIGDCEIESIYTLDGIEVMLHVTYRLGEGDIFWDGFSILEQQRIIDKLIELLQKLGM